MATEIDKSQYVLPNDQPVVKLEVTSAFNGLSAREKLYAHYLSQASWQGGLIVLIQTSPESGPIFVLFHKLFSKQNPTDFKQAALNAGFKDADVIALFVYVCGLFCNAGNYKGFGDTKFIPNIDQSTLENLLKVSPIWSELEPLWNKIKDALYELKPGKTCLGYPPEGCTTYLSKNCTSEDNATVLNFLKTKKIDCYNTRLLKNDKNGSIEYEIRLAAGEQGVNETIVEKGITYKIVKGDYSPLMDVVAKNLQEAVKYAASDIEENMLKAYIKSFITGDLDQHKEGSRYWIQDKGPAVETYIGFIETYRDPAGVRGEFEGFVAVVNREMTVKFSNLVSKAEDLLQLLPWGKSFERDEFVKPDFTSLDVVTFAGSGIPAGINIPNYDEIRQNDGYKNVSLGNVIPASYQQSVTPFLSQADADLLKSWIIQAFEVQVGLHELIGHGSGKLFKQNADGSLNFSEVVLDPTTGAPVSSWYAPGDSYDIRFGPLSSTYEECRAEAIGLYLSLEPEVLKIFGYTGQEAEDVMYINWLSLVWNGAGKALELWDPSRGWLQAHAQARFVIANVLIEAGVAKVSQPTEGDLLVTLDRSKIKTEGKQALGDFLLKLHVFKCLGNIEAGTALYNHYADVKEPWTSWRSIILANKQPRKMFVQPNTVANENASDVTLNTYEASLDGLIQSWIERFDSTSYLYEAILSLSNKDEHCFI